MNFHKAGLILFIFFSQLANPFAGINTVDQTLLSSHSISLDKRYEDKFVSTIFKDNILLNIAYLSGKVSKKDTISWDNIGKPFSYKFTLAPNETFAFHDDVLPKYQKTVVKTTNASFNFDDGFKSDGYLIGDGVCHLASLMYWVAKDANLEAYAPTNHDFAVIPGIERKYGVAIYKMPGNSYSNQMQNLYITNNKNKTVTFDFEYKRDLLAFSVYEGK